MKRPKRPTKSERRRLPVLHHRSCGDCTVCCTILSVDEIGKPYHEDCKHLVKKGCGIYSTRPHSCRVFQCLWLQGLFSEEDRPDKLGIMFHVTGEKGELGQVPVAWEVWEGAARVPATRDLLDKLALKMPVIVAGREKRYILGYEGDINVDFA